MLRIYSSMFFVVVIFAKPAAAQHVHEQHPTIMHDGYYRVELEGSDHSNPSVQLDSEGNYMIFNEWLVNSSCNEVERGNSYSRSVSHRVHVQITGEIEWGVEAGAKILAAELKTYSKARVELNGGWSGEWKEVLSFSSKTDLKPCQKIWYVFLKNRRKASGFVDTWEHKITCLRPSTLDIAHTYCNKRRLSGTGVGWGTHIGEHVQRGLVENCPCSDIDSDTVHVFDPTVPVPVPEIDPPVEGDSEQGGTDQNSTQEGEVTGSPPPSPEQEPEWKLMNPIKKDNTDRQDD